MRARLISTLATALAPWALAAFGTLELNPLHWDALIRISVATLSMFFGTCQWTAHWWGWKA